MLRRLLDAHKDVVTQLAEGFRECRKHIENEETVSFFLDDTLTSRLGMRILVEHHLELHDEKPNHIGIINTAMKPKDLIEKWCLAVKSISEHKYSRSPDFKLNGHLNCSFPYIELPLDYILPEILKNAVRATAESHLDSPCLPPITITIANNNQDFVIRVSDRGGGIPASLIKKVTNYHFSTANENKADQRLDGGLFGSIMSEPNDYSMPMHGFGFGLPTSKAYAKYLCGSLTLISMHGTGGPLNGSNNAGSTLNLSLTTMDNAFDVVVLGQNGGSGGGSSSSAGASHLHNGANTPKTKPLVVTAEQVVKLYGYKLTNYETQEIYSYTHIYFIGANAKKRCGIIGTPENSGYDDMSGSYIHVPHDHIAYRSRRGKLRGTPGSKDWHTALKNCDDVYFIDFIERCLDWDPYLRMTPYHALRHSWLRSRRKLPRPPNNFVSCAQPESSDMYGTSCTGENNIVNSRLTSVHNFSNSNISSIGGSLANGANSGSNALENGGVTAKPEVLDDEDTGLITAGAIVTVTVTLERKNMEIYVNKSKNSLNAFNQEENNDEENQLDKANKVSDENEPTQKQKPPVWKKVAKKGKSKGKKKGTIKKMPLTKQSNNQPTKKSDEDSDSSNSNDSENEKEDNNSDVPNQDSKIKKKDKDVDTDEDDDWDKFQEKVLKKDKTLESKPKFSHSVHCPFFYDDKQENWWIYMVDRKRPALVTVPVLMTSLIDYEEIELKFTAPSKPDNDLNTDSDDSEDDTTVDDSA
ncbi:hypothetical protein RND71_043676 [Anisodus tanguticus]|uniref:Protein-serine/threonine kinase n=1 Tax=Anisodus tanguticus TaxID=243964 RepID=A0AAE1QR09_9SOLA|nr:hypothetical protein RND71_043676 [Anisodus tanguticus]